MVSSTLGCALPSSCYGKFPEKRVLHRYFGVFYGFLERGAQDKRLFLEDQEPFARRPERRQARL